MKKCESFHLLREILPDFPGYLGQSIAGYWKLNECDVGNVFWALLDTANILLTISFGYHSQLLVPKQGAEEICKWSLANYTIFHLFKKALLVILFNHVIGSHHKNDQLRWIKNRVE